MKLLCRFRLLLFLALGCLTVVSSTADGNTPRTLMVPMRDGVKLATDIYLPSQGNSRFPVVLMRTPYNKRNTGEAEKKPVQLGYAVVIQDTRGRFASEGDNLPFNMEDRDGADTVRWITQQGWCNGKVGTFGGSALGIAQLQLAGTGVEGLACQHITVGEPDLFNVVYIGGVFRKSLVEDWLRACNFNSRALVLWTGHCMYDRYWLTRDATRHFRAVNAPAIHIGGYFDIFAQGTIDAFVGFQTRGGPGARGKQKLLMGPWTHGVLTDKAGDLVFPGGNRPPNNVQDQTRWWECYLKGVVNGVAELPAVTYYVMGDTHSTNAPGNVWRTANEWPPVPTRNTRWFFQPDQGLGPSKHGPDFSFAYIYDPTKPAPTMGGYQLTIPAGPKDQRPIEERADVLVFTSQPLTAPMEVTGRVRARLYVTTDVPDSDFFVRLCDVYPDGASFNVCEGMIRARYRRSLIETDFLEPNKVYPIDIDLWSTSIIFNQGHRVRVDVTSSSAPGFDPNPNTEEPLRWSSRINVAHHRIYASGHSPSSYIELPVARE
jgi:predicted acyl esterase